MYFLDIPVCSFKTFAPIVCWAFCLSGETDEMVATVVNLEEFPHADAAEITIPHRLGHGLQSVEFKDTALEVDSLDHPQHQHFPVPQEDRRCLLVMFVVTGKKTSSTTALKKALRQQRCCRHVYVQTAHSRSFSVLFWQRLCANRT